MPKPRQIQEFLRDELKLELHPNKIFIKTLVSGMDFLGLVNFFDHRVLRTKTKKRILRKIKKKYSDLQDGIISEKSFNQSLQSYFGILKHCCGYKVKKKILAILEK